MGSKRSTAFGDPITISGEEADIEPSVPNPKFVKLFSLLRTNFGFEKDTSKLMILVWFWI